MCFQKIIAVILIIFLILFSVPCIATSEQEFDQLFQLSLDELSNIQVTTASRLPQRLDEAPVTIDVITAEEIKASGAIEIWDLMRFRVGMDVLDARAGDGNRGIVSVRGFAREYVNNLQILVDGRSVFSGYGGGVYWPQLPVQIQDIERIEIVRGPNAALHGSNAGLGVIQIFTKKPAQQEATLETHVGDPRARRNMFAVGHINDNNNAGWRFSYTRRDDEVFVTSSGKPGNDQIESDKANLRGFFNPAAGTSVELFSGGSWDTNTVPRSNEGRFRNVFGMAKLTHALGESSSIEATTSYAKSRQKLVPITSTLNWGKVDYNQLDAGMMHSFAWMEDSLHTTWGVEYRKYEANSDVVFEAKPTQVNEVWRAFSHQTYRFNDRLSFIGALALENSDTGDTEPAYQLTALWNATKQHLFRFSYAIASTLPSLYRKSVNHQPSSFGRIVGNPDLKPEKLQSYEVSYLGRLMQGKLRVESSIFYVDIDDVSASESFANPDAPPPFLVTFNNDNHATAVGLEGKLSYRFSRGTSVYANYTYQVLSDELDDIMVIDSTPRHKFNLGGIAKLSRYTLSANGGYKSDYSTIPANRSAALIRKISDQFRLDLRLAYQPNDRLEFALAGQNLLESHHIEFSDFDGLEISRTIYASMRLDL